MTLLREPLERCLLVILVIFTFACTEVDIAKDLDSRRTTAKGSQESNLEDRTLRAETTQERFGLETEDSLVGAVKTEPLSYGPAVPSPMNRDDWIELTSQLEPTGPEGTKLQRLAMLHPDAEVRKSALERLGDASEESAIHGFIAALGDEDLEVVQVAIEQLKHREDRSAILHLEDVARSHTEEEIRQAASAAIEFLE